MSALNKLYKGFTYLVAFIMILVVSDLVGFSIGSILLTITICVSSLFGYGSYFTSNYLLWLLVISVIPSLVMFIYILKTSARLLKENKKRVTQ